MQYSGGGRLYVNRITSKTYSPANHGPRTVIINVDPAYM